MSKTQIKIPVESFVREELNDDDVNAVLDFWEIIANETDPEFIPSPREQRIKSMRRKNDQVRNFDWLVRKDDDIIATAVVGEMSEKSPSYEQNKQTAFATIDVHPRYRRQGIGKALLTKIIEQLSSMNKKVVIVGSSHEEGKKVATHWGGKVALESAENRLYLNEVDWDMVKSWVEEGPKRAPGVILREFTNLPDDIADEYLDVYSEVMNQQPLGDMEVEMKESIESRREREERFDNIGMIWNTLITQEEDGSISGLTELYYNPQNGYKAGQDLTGVKQEYRGKGLGKWLKAEMLLRYRERYPDLKFISTGNADSNAPMLSINNRLGFKRFKSSVNYNFDVEELTKKFNV